MNLHTAAVGAKQERARAFGWGAGIATLGGLIGLGGAEFRLPVLIGVFGLAIRAAVVVNLSISLVTVLASLGGRLVVQGPAPLVEHVVPLLTVLAGALVGAHWGAGMASRASDRSLRVAIAVILLAIGILMMAHASVLALPQPSLGVLSQLVLGIAAGVGIGIVSSLLGVAGGELIIPTLVLLYGIDIKAAGTVSLCISLMTLSTGLLRMQRLGTLTQARVYQPLLVAMALGSIVGAALGSVGLAYIEGQWLHGLLGTILVASAIKMGLSSRASHTSSKEEIK